MVGAHQNLNGSRDLFSHAWARTGYCQPAYQMWSLSPPTTKIWKVIQNLENGVVWVIRGHHKVTENSAIR